MVASDCHHRSPDILTRPLQCCAAEFQSMKEIRLIHIYLVEDPRCLRRNKIIIIDRKIKPETVSVIDPPVIPFLQFLNGSGKIDILT